MKLFLYYFSHSFVNTIKRVMKTWLAFLIICVVFGIVIGLVGSLASSGKKKAETDEGDVQVEVTDPDEDEVAKAIEETGFKRAIHERGLSKYNVVDLAVSLAFFLYLALNVATANKAGKIFQPADVPMLFASPLKPQSVMMFRLIGSLAVSMLLSIYMIFQIPNLVTNVKLSLGGSISLIVVYGLFLIFGTLVQVTFYTVASRVTKKKVKFTNFLLVFYGALLGAFAVYTFASGKDLLTALFDFFAGQHTYVVPFWGWMRGIAYYAMIGKWKMSLLYLALNLVAFALLVILIWNMKADFYEDALVETERKAQMIEAAKSASAGGVRKREKNRSDKLDREGFHYGSGAMVFFYKTLYNRFRLAYFKVFSKTMLTYLAIAGSVVALVRYKTDMGDKAFLFAVCTLGVMVFYRTLGNPLHEDTTREFFVLVPATPMEKLWCSLLGGLCVTAIDLSLPIIVAAVIAQASVFQVIGWFFFILSLDLFGTATGAFIDVSIPGETGKTMKAMAQIIFLYFGLLPAAVCVVVGMILQALPIALLIGALFNAGLAALFVLITPHFLVNR